MDSHTGRAAAAGCKGRGVAVAEQRRRWEESGGWARFGWAWKGGLDKIGSMVSTEARVVKI